MKRPLPSDRETEETHDEEQDKVGLADIIKHGWDKLRGKIG